MSRRRKASATATPAAPAPVAKKVSRSDALREIGTSMPKQSGGRIMDEILNELKSSKGRAKLYREMRDNSAVIGAARFAIDSLLRQTPVRVEPGGDAPEDLRAHQFIDECFTDMSKPWGDHLRQALTHLDYGWAATEIVYKRRLGMQEDGGKRSRYTDGLIGWRKVTLRPQATLERWEFDEEGGTQGMWQRPPNGGADQFIPIEKLLHFRTTDDGPEGRSIFRNAVMSWKFFKRMAEIEGIGVERDTAGIPVFWAPPEIFGDNATPDQVAMRETLQTLVANLRNDEHAGVGMPLMYDENNNKMYDLTLLITGGRKQFDTNVIIQRYEQRLLMVMLADFVMLGHEKVGSFSLSSDKTDLFAVAMGGVLDSVVEVWNRFGIPRLLDLNGIRAAPPVLKHGDIEKTDLAALGAYLVNLTTAGLLTPSEELEAHCLDLANLPAPAGAAEDVGKSAGALHRLIADVAKLREQAEAGR